MPVIRRIFILLVVATAGITAFVVLRRDDETPVTAAPVLKTALLERGSLSTSERIDGSVTLSNSMTILHRIEGQTSSAVGATTPASSGATGVPRASSSSAYGRLTVVPCETTTDETTTTTSTVVPCDVATTTTTTATTTTTPDAAADSTTTTVPDAGGGAGPTGGGGGFAPAPSGATPAGGSGGSATSGSASSTARVTQIVTSVIADGSDLGLGDVIYTVDSESVVALSGALPAWRTMSTDSDDGPDIRQLESSLVSLGYDPDGTVIVDDTFDGDTEAMVERWQAGLDDEVTGEVALGSVVFLPAGTRVTAVEAAVGDAVGDGDSIVTVSTATQQVVIDVPDGMEAAITPGLEVGVGTTTGVVDLLRSVERDGAVVVEAVITPAAPIDGAENGSTVKVAIDVEALDDVLLAPADALLSHLDGSYAVQVQRDDGTVEWVDVDLLGVSGNRVAIAADTLDESSTVLIPA